MKAVLAEDVRVAKAVRAADVQAAGVPVVPDHKVEARKANAHDVRQLNSWCVVNTFSLGTTQPQL